MKYREETALSLTGFMTTTIIDLLLDSAHWKHQETCADNWSTSFIFSFRYWEEQTLQGDYSFTLSPIPLISSICCLPEIFLLSAINFSLAYGYSWLLLSLSTVKITHNTCWHLRAHQIKFKIKSVYVYIFQNGISNIKSFLSSSAAFLPMSAPPPVILLLLDVAKIPFREEILVFCKPELLSTSQEVIT